MAIHFSKSVTYEDQVAYIRKSVKKLQKYDDAYYNSSDSLVTDEDYDLYREKIQAKVKKLYKTYKGRLADVDSYFEGVRTKVRESKRTEKLPLTLGSLKKTKNDNDSGMSNFIKRGLVASQAIAKDFSKRKQPKLRAHYESLLSLVISPKLDGLTFFLHYKNRKLYAAYSGGDGVHGQEKMAHAKALIHKGSIPKKLTSNVLANFDHEDLYVIGEVVCSKKKFEKVVDAQKKAKEKNPYKEVRNAASGWVNSEQPPDVLTDAVDFVAYEIKTDSGDLGCELDITDLNIGASRHSNKNLIVNLLDSLGFQTYKSSPLFTVTSVASYDEGLKRMLDNYLSKLKEQEYPLDGIVVEVSDSRIRKHMGIDKKGTPYFAVAYKVSADSAIASGQGEKTRVVDIDWNPSKVGALKPTLIYKPITIGKSTFTQATGNNYVWLVDKGIGLGTKLAIVKAGDVIPKAYFADKEKAMPDKIRPSKCKCGAKVVHPWDDKNKPLPDLYCSKGAGCSISKKEQLAAAIKATQVTGLGSKNIEKLYDAGYTDIFELIEAARDKKGQKNILKIEGFGKSAIDTLSVALPRKLVKMDNADLMAMSGLFVRPGLALAKASFVKASSLIDKANDSKEIKEKDCIKVLGKAKGALLYANFDAWLKYRKRLKKLVAG